MVKRLISQGTRGYLNLGEVLGRKKKGSQWTLEA